jgi:hypothetical protein
VDFVDKEHVPVAEIGDDGRQVPRPLYRRARRYSQVAPDLGGDDISQRGLAQARRSVEQYMVERLIPAPGSGNSYFQVFNDLGLPDEIVQAPRSQTGIKRNILIGGFT